MKIECPKCASKNVLAKKSGLSFCRRCGYEGPTPEFRPETECEAAKK